MEKETGLPDTSTLVHYSQKSRRERLKELDERSGALRKRLALKLRHIPHYRKKPGLKRLFRVIEGLLSSEERVVVALAGPAGSGKSTMARAIAEKFNGAYFSCDMYYKPRRIALRTPFYYDNPKSVKLRKLAADLTKFRKGKAVHIPIMELKDYTQTGELVIDPQCTKVLVVEGGVVLEPEVIGCFDVKVYVECRFEQRLARMVERDVKEKGRTREHVIDRTLSTREEGRLRFIEPKMAKADMIIRTRGI